MQRKWIYSKERWWWCRFLNGWPLSSPPVSNRRETMLEDRGSFPIPIRDHRKCLWRRARRTRSWMIDGRLRLKKKKKEEAHFALCLIIDNPRAASLNTQIALSKTFPPSTRVSSAFVYPPSVDNYHREEKLKCQAKLTQETFDRITFGDCREQTPKF